MSDAVSPGAGSRARATGLLALVAYLGLLALGGLTIWQTLIDLDARRDQVAEAGEQLARLTSRASGEKTGPETWGVEPGTQFLGGDKSTVAVATLQDRVAKTVDAAGGRVASSQVERVELKDKDKSADIELSLECEIDQPGLQRLLYELESTTPFVFVNALNVRVRESGPERRDEPRLRVSLRVGAVWRIASP